MGSTLIIGSINMDIVNKVRNHPLPGETIHSFETSNIPGGKGANQAIAAHLTGGRVTFVGAVGQDVLAKQLLSHFQIVGLETKHIHSKTGLSGMAFITVDEHGENQIVLSSGANTQLSIEDILAVIQGGNWGTILLQNEISWEVTAFAIKEASQKGVKVVFNPAPALNIPEHILSLIDILILNETEAEYITGVEIRDRSNAVVALQWLINRGVNEVIITLGKKGALYLNRDQYEIFQPPFLVNVVDTTAAGDTFIGAFIAAKNNSHYTTKDCLHFASAAAALCITRKGAQSSIPTIREVKDFLSSYNTNE